MASFSKKLRSVSLPVKVASGAVLVAAVVIFLSAGFLRGAVHEAFESQLNSVLDEKAFQHRVRFSRSVEAYHHAVKLLSTQRSLIEHLQYHEQKGGHEHAHVIKGKPPEWLPNFTFLRSFIAPQYALLFDDQSKLLDLYQNWPVPAPEELLGLHVSSLELAIGQTHIIMIGTTPFLLAAEHVKDDDEKVVGTVLLSTPLDDVFMIAANGPATNWNLVALIDDASGRVISSNSSNMIPRGRSLEALTKKHLFTEPKFLALGGMELEFRFASLVNKDSVGVLAEGVTENERTVQLAEALVYMGPFIVIIYWLTRRVLRLTKKVEGFSLDLGYEHASLQRIKGDQIDILEQRFQQLTLDIKKRTSQLVTANQELEAFAYSVSHDLRAPLRSIDGFSQALDEDYHDQLDETGHDYLQRVRKAAQRMGTLIDEMLMLSRVSRSEMKMRRVDISRIAEQVIQELQQDHPEREIEVRITKGLEVIGDEGLLRVAVTNLLDNAWKFTLKTEAPVIEFGLVNDPSGPVPEDLSSRVYYVADNGAGFDMEFVDKLFGAFQRLHRDTEFPGTGVGLATVQRIISRHEGRIWAESEVDKGAKFFFSI